MRIKNLRLKNYRLFKDIDINFPDKEVIVLIGENGSGKTAVLDSIASSLVHLTGKIVSFKDDKWSIDKWFGQSDIKNNEINSSIVLTTANEEYSYKIKLVKSIDQKGFTPHINPEDKIKNIRSAIKDKSQDSLPLLTFYDTYRTKIKDEAKNNKPFYDPILEGYRDTFNPKVSSFSQFQQWFIKQENIENERKIDRDNIHYTLPSLEIIRKALTTYLEICSISSFGKIRGKRELNGHSDFNGKDNESVYIQKDNDFIKLSQLSEGEKMMIYIVADIARRLTILNKTNDNSLEGDGIVLIDEVEMHLHPSWQRYILPALTATFPNIQFIVTTHSPQIISSISSEAILVMIDKEAKRVNYKTHGFDSNTLLKKVFDTQDKPFEVVDIIQKIDDAINNEEEPQKVKGLINKIIELDNKDPGEGSNPIIDDLLIQLESYKFDLEHDPN